MTSLATPSVNDDATASLGDLLRRKIEREEADKLAKLRADTVELDQKAQAELACVEAFFSSAQAQFTAAILEGRNLPRAVLGHRQNVKVASLLETYRWTSSGPAKTQRFYPVWEKFEDWARSNGLQAKWSYEHDGVGIESWYVLVVSP